MKRWMQVSIYYYVIFCGLMMPLAAEAQNYRALHGSSQAGALGAANNPSSILHVPFKWDLTLFAVQEAHTTNAFYLDDYSLLSPGDSANIFGHNETTRRFVFANQDIRLFNARIRLSPQKAIAFGVNLRSYLFAKTSKFTFYDTATEMRHYMELNRDNIPLSGELRGSAWAEVFGTYAQSLIDNEQRILNAGITVSVTRGLAGGHLNVGNIGFSATPNDPHKYVLSDATIRYGYSANIDDVDAAQKGSKRSALTRRTFSSVSFSGGLEYIVPVRKVGDELNDYHYDFKIGLSILDLGFSNYRYSANSRDFILDGGNLADSTIESRFDGISSLEDINDTLARMASSTRILSGYFRIFQPARIVLNFDKNIEGNLFVNGELTIPLTPVLGDRHLYVRDMNFIAITPRLENRKWGAYLPFTINARGQAWLGGAVKAGPLLLGLHNWANVFAKNKMQEGGFYMALTFKPGKKRPHTSREKMPKLSKEHRRQLNCPRF